jgi:ethanolamine permease
VVSRQLSRQVNRQFQTPHWALIAGGLVGFVALFTGTTDQVIIMSVLGALLMYVMSMLSLFALRKKEPDLERPFKAPFIPMLRSLRSRFRWFGLPDCDHLLQPAA